MSAYVVFIRERTIDPAELATYAGMVGAAREGHDFTPLALYGAIETLDGEPVEGSVILKFATSAEARAWFDSPAYQAAAAHRRAGAEYHVFITEGLD